MKLKPKGPGRGIMISDFVDEHDGFLKLSDEDFARYQQRDPSLQQSAWKQLVIGHGNEGYWRNEHFLKSVKDAMPHISSTPMMPLCYPSMPISSTPMMPLCYPSMLPNAVESHLYCLLHECHTLYSAPP